MSDLRPELKHRVEKTSFMIVIEQNYVMRRLLKKRTDDIYDQSLLLQKTTMRNSKKKFQEKLIAILVNEFENIFTSPDQVFLLQDDPPDTDCREKAKDDDDSDNEEEKQPFMYFIRTGQFDVTIKSNFGNKDKGPFKKQLYDGDHFGEIGLIYNSKRTATVKSGNYGTLARLTEHGFKELEKQFQNLRVSFKEYIFKYKDDLRTFLEMECDKIKYFKDLSMITK